MQRGLDAEIKQPNSGVLVLKVALMPREMKYSGDAA